MEIMKDMYDLPQASKLANKLWQYEKRDSTFCLVVDNFGLKYTNMDDADCQTACL
jgi:Mg2+/Co2+ transporter CorB